MSEIKLHDVEIIATVVIKHNNYTPQVETMEICQYDIEDLIRRKWCDDNNIHVEFLENYNIEATDITIKVLDND